MENKYYDHLKPKLPKQSFSDMINEQLNIVDSLTSDGGFGGVNIILKKCITDIWELDFVPSIYNKN